MPPWLSVVIALDLWGDMRAVSCSSFLRPSLVLQDERFTQRPSLGPCIVTDGMLLNISNFDQRQAAAALTSCLKPPQSPQSPSQHL